MKILVAIEDCVAAGQGGLPELWDAWLSGAMSVASTTPFDVLREQTAVAIEVLLKKKSVSRQGTGLILATTKGDIDAEVRCLRAADGLGDSPRTPAGQSGDPPTLGHAAESLAHRLQLNGPAWAVSTACSSGLIGIIEAALSLIHGEADRMLAVGLDVAGDFVRDGFAALKAISPTHCRPFDARRDGLSLGSAGAACLLARADRTHNPLCLLRGWAAASDAVHMTAPDRNAGGLIRTIEQALCMAALAPAQIDVIVAHGTGTRYNDAMEAVAIQHVFGNEQVSAERPPPARLPLITAVKGLIGHTLGASGVVETALATQMFAHQIVPPITNLQTPEYPALNLVVGSPRKPTRPIRHILKLASGFGGLNAAVILSAPQNGNANA